MNTGIVQYDLDDFDTYSDIVKNYITTLNDALVAIDDDVDGSDSIWSGEAHESFKNSYKPISDNCVNLIGSLDILKDNLKTIKEMYSVHEDNTAKISQKEDENMGNEQITFNHPEVESMYNRINTQWGIISSVLDDLDKNTNVIPESWKSLAADNFRDSYDGLIKKNVESLKSSFDSFVTKLKVVYKSYGYMEQGIAALGNPEASEDDKKLGNIVNNFGGLYNNNIRISDEEDGSIYIEYTVVANDTLGNIGTKMGVDWKILQEQNNITNANLINIGQVIRYKIKDGGVV